MTENDKAAVQQVLGSISAQIMEEMRTTLFMRLRYMRMAVGRLEPVRDDMVFTLAAEGKHIYYAPRYVIKLYKEEKNALLRAYVHTVLHCLFLHPFVSESIDKNKWNFACDVAVENAISHLEIDELCCRNVQYQEKFLSKLRASLDSLTAEKIYNYLCQNNFTDKEIELERKNFKRDSHQLWFSEKKKKTENQELQQGEPMDSEGAENLAEIISQWKSYCEQMNVDMESFSSSERGSKVMVQNTRRVQRDKYDYGVFLKKFAVTGEDITINDEEFDYIYYTYGLEKYKNMPLVEPLEYKEIRKISEFVIAIDTSGSVQGELVQRFLDKTYSILMAQENFFNKINIRIMQCDDKIEDEFVVREKEDFEYYIKNIKFKGFGGTDFTPVFERVNHLVETGEFVNLKGIIYFTDGYGKYPAKRPDYDAAFIFLEYDPQRPKVPAWAMGVVIDEKSL